MPPQQLIGHRAIVLWVAADGVQRESLKVSTTTVKHHNAIPVLDRVSFVNPSVFFQELVTLVTFEVGKPPAVVLIDEKSFQMQRNDVGYFEPIPNAVLCIIIYLMGNYTHAVSRAQLPLKVGISS
ncbi:MAG: casein kinase I [Chaenotheca gracillima]|nr:MAG: casein kinase I [Chaenotheca gracillima]